MISREWKEVALSEVMDVKHGFAFSGESISDEPPGDILLTPGNFAIGGGFKADKFKYFHGDIPEDYVLNEDDLIVTMTDLSKQSDTLGYPALVPKPSGFRFLHNQRLGKVLIRNRTELAKRYLYYLLCTADYRHEVLASATGTTVKHTSPSRILAHKVRLPSVSIQSAIADILGSLDDKIELNRRTNETLEAMARAVFKSWFVDFEPVHAKAKGRQPDGMDAETAKLFPSAFVDSEIGRVPKGWVVGRLGDALNVVETGFRPTGGIKDITEGVPSVGAESIVGLGRFDYGKTRYVPRSFYEDMSRGHACDGDILLYKDGGRPGEFEPHVTMIGEGFPFSEFCINEHVYRLRVAPRLPQSYLFFWLSSDSVMEEMRNRGTGVAIPGLNSTAVRELTLLSPASAITASFDACVSPLIDSILANCNESRTLAIIREALLPRLLSGELAVPLSKVA
jgi:type I restriction enzyme S subunit